MGNQFPCFGGEVRVVGDGPEGHVSVQQQPHSALPPNSLSIVSLSASMSSGTEKRPFAMPMRGPAGGGVRGTSLAAGLALRAMMISDSVPLSTASTRRERLDLASSMLTTGILRRSWLDLAKLD